MIPSIVTRIHDIHKFHHPTPNLLCKFSIFYFPHML